jgi:hypothetical protein
MFGPLEADGAMDWEYTGNHYVFVPRLARGTAGIHAVNIVHRGLDGLVEWRSSMQPDPERAPLFGIQATVDETEAPVTGFTWDRLDGWIPRGEAPLARDLRIVVTVCAPPGYEALARGVLVRIDLENRGATMRRVGLAFGGTWAHTLRCVATTRPLTGRNRLIAAVREGGFILETGEGQGAAALAIVGTATPVELVGGVSDTTPTTLQQDTTLEAADGEPLRFSIRQTFDVGPRRRVTVAFAIAAGMERDGALATAVRLAAQDSGEVIQAARLEVTRLGRRSAPRRVGDLARRNLLFAAFSGVARSIDDDRLYPVASRFLEHGPCAAVDERDILLGTLPALTIADPFLARELLLRMFEIYSDRAGTHLRYLSGGVLSPGLSITRFCAYAEAIDGYVRDAADPSFADEPLIQDVLREMDDWLWGRLHRDLLLCSTELGPSGEKPDYAFVTVDNVRAWRFCGILERHWRPRDGEPPARFREGAEEMAAAIWQHCVIEHEGAPVFAGSVDLEGNAAIYDDPEGSLAWLPHLGFCDAADPVWTNTMDLLHSAAYPLWRRGNVDGLVGRNGRNEASLWALCAELTLPGPERDLAVQRVLALDFEGGLAARAWDPATGRATNGPWSAPHAGLLAWSLLREPRPERPLKGRKATRP